jgi:hypothetical protein
VDKQLPPLIQALHNPACYGHPVQDIRVVETHISWVLLTGPFAYKIKKPVNFGFLDFSTLEQRRFYCEEELRLNRRLAPQLYLELVRIIGEPTTPVLNGPGAVIEYAVKMVQFPQEAQLDRMLARGALGPEHIDRLAQELGEFHGRIDIAGNDKPFGEPENVYEPVHQNFEQIRPRIDPQDQAQLRRLEIWSELTFAELKQSFAERKQRGFIRECHGDAHLANMAWLDDVQEHECREGQGWPRAAGRVVLFDCLEFNANLRWIDVMSELAFVVMDIDDRGRPDLARRALNAYLEHTGDYAGLSVFRFYLVYRALVRAKVACLRLRQNGLSEKEQQQARDQYRSYADLADRYIQASTASLIITHGLSGSGKTTVTQSLLETEDAVRVRSDVERKRLHGLASQARSGSGIDTGLYSTEAGQRTYTQLATLAEIILRAGYTAIVDAAFLKRAQRDQLHAVAKHMRAPFAMLDIGASENVLRERVRRRAQRGHDASEADLAVLAQQLATQEPVTAEELPHVIAIDSERPLDMGALVHALRERVQPAT